MQLYFSVLTSIAVIGISFVGSAHAQSSVFSSASSAASSTSSAMPCLPRAMEEKGIAATGTEYEVSDTTNSSTGVRTVVTKKLLVSPITYIEKTEITNNQMTARGYDMYQSNLVLARTELPWYTCNNRTSRVIKYTEQVMQNDYPTCTWNAPSQPWIDKNTTTSGRWEVEAQMNPNDRMQIRQPPFSFILPNGPYITGSFYPSYTVREATINNRDRYHELQPPPKYSQPEVYRWFSMEYLRRLGQLFSGRGSTENYMGARVESRYLLNPNGPLSAIRGTCSLQKKAGDGQPWGQPESLECIGSGPPNDPDVLKRAEIVAHVSQVGMDAACDIGYGFFVDYLNNRY